MKDADIRIMNYEGLRLLVDYHGRKLRLTELGKQFFKRGKRIMLAVDESSKMRHTNTVRFKSLKEILHRFCRRYILTGSPAPNGLMNLFGQVYILDFGEALGKYITHYRNEYFMPVGYGGYSWKLQHGSEKRIFRKLSPLVLRYGTDQLDLPPITFIDVKFDLPKKARKLYDEMEQEYISMIEKQEIVAANAAVATGKCRQIANGGVFYNKAGDIVADPKAKDIRGWKTVHDMKCEALVELLEELEGEPALVAYEYEHDKLRLKKYLAKHAPQFKDAPFVGGGTKDKDLRRILKQWDKGELPLVFGQPDSVAHGLNLQGKGGIVIYFALTWNLENYEQFYQRVWRQGQKRRVLCYRLIARNTVDEDQIRALRAKDRTQQGLLKAMEKRTSWRRQLH
jgi:SNF2 family DNA or RNA helicase